MEKKPHTLEVAKDKVIKRKVNKDLSRSNILQFLNTQIKGKHILGHEGNCLVCMGHEGNCLVCIIRCYDLVLLVSTGFQTRPEGGFDIVLIPTKPCKNISSHIYAS